MSNIEILLSSLRQELHAHPESSGKEINTRKILCHFLHKYTTLDVQEFGGSLFAIHSSPQATEKPIAFRADMDAVTVKPGDVRHLCGHDGHSTSLFAFALVLQRLTLNRDVVLVFQAAEEDGSGARKALPFLRNLGVERIYGYHNIPQGKEGEIWLREDTFACASQGLILHLHGAVSHAAYPENGKNPVYVLGRLIHYIEQLNHTSSQDISFITPVGIQGGNPSFGVACGEVSLLLTLRCAKENKLMLNKQRLLSFLAQECEQEGLTFDYEEVDVFPETANRPQAFADVLTAVKAAHLSYILLKEPMRWSEDFGVYTQDITTCYFGIGTGTGAGLHTDEYHFNDRILLLPAKIYLRICENLGKVANDDR